MPAIEVQNQMLEQIEKASTYMRQKINDDGATKERTDELQRLQRLHDELSWFKSEY